MTENIGRKGWEDFSLYTSSYFLNFEISEYVTLKKSNIFKTQRPNEHAARGRATPEEDGL